MTSKLTYIALALYAIAYLLLFLIWGALLEFGKTGVDASDYISYIHDALLMPDRAHFDDLKFRPDSATRINHRSCDTTPSCTTTNR